MTADEISQLLFVVGLSILGIALSVIAWNLAIAMIPQL